MEDNQLSGQEQFNDPDDGKFAYNGAADQQAENNDGGNDATPPAPPAVETKQDQNQPVPNAEGAEGAQPPAAEPDATPDTGQKPSRAERRIRGLTAKVRELTAQPPAPQGDTNAPQPPTAPVVAPAQLKLPEDGEITPEQYQRDVVTAADLLVQQRMQEMTRNLEARSQARERAREVDTDMQAINSQYEVLNEDSPSFDPTLSERISAAYELASDSGKRYIPLKRFVDQQMELVNIAAQRAGAKAQASGAQAAATGALTPTTQKAVEKPFHELSTDEMEKKLGWA
jgi:hypothetical protein